MLRYMLLAVLVAVGAQVQAEMEQRQFCIYDPMGANGSMYGLMKDYKTNALEWGFNLKLRAYSDEKIAIDDFKATQCDAMLITGSRARPFNKFAATVGGIGAVPSHEVMRNVVNTLSSPKASKLMVEGRYEVTGMLPTGPVYLFLRDRTVDTVEELSGKRIATFEYDQPSIKLVNHVGASVVPSNSANFSGRFNNGSVDVAYAPVVAYKPLEMYKGLGDKGGVMRFNLAYLDFQMIVHKDRFNEDFGLQSRQAFADMFDRAIHYVEKDTAEIDEKYWMDLSKEDTLKYNRMLRDVRIALREEGVYDGRMLRLLRRLRCTENPTAAECAERLE